MENNLLYYGDNLSILKEHIKDESVDLIYIDPPFFSNRNYEVVFGDEAEIRSFEDRWEGGINVYIEWMRERVKELHRVLKPTGSLYLHCDWHASHHLRVMLDEEFGEHNFRNEIIWCYQERELSKRHYNLKHDTILFYVKNYDSNYVFNYNDVRETYSNVTLGKFKYTDENGGKYRLRYKDGRSDPPLETEDTYRQYLDESGPLARDWFIIPILNQNAKERLGYPTQKPEPLLERIIKASSNKGDVVLDAFCGCGTSLAVAQKLGRQWIGIDISPTAIKLIEQRLQKIGAIKDKTYITINTPTTVNDLKEFKPFEFQNWVIDELKAKHSKKKVGDMGIDGYFTKDLWHEEAGIQVKQSESVGRNVVDNFETALKRANYKRGYIVAFSFSKGAHEEAARVNKEDLDIKLIKVSDLFYKKSPIL
ncbi:MAG: DNA methyltransferase [Candidatus Poribacteria bacterium]